MLLIAAIVSTVACDSDYRSALRATSVAHRNRTNIADALPPDVVQYDLNIDPITHLEMIKETIEMDKRVRRNPLNRQLERDYDRGYDEYLRNYRGDNGGERYSSGRRGNYKVKDSAEERSESNENDDDEDNSNEDDEDDETSDEKSSQSKKVKSRDKNYKQKHDSDDDYERIKQESGKTKKSKYCKPEKRGNMLCNVCHNPKNDEKSESCKFTDPKDKKYAYSNEKNYSHKENDDDRESFEEAREFTTKRPPQQNGPPRFNGPRPYNNRYPIKPIPPQSTYRRIPRPPGPYSIIRYRTVSLPRPQRIRIITLPGPPPPPPPPLATPLPSAQYNQRPYPFTTLETRPQRDTVWLQNRRPYSEQLVAPQNESKSHEIELLPDHLNQSTDAEFADFTSKDWSDCRKYTEGELLCFECGQKTGAIGKECMFATKKKPEESRQFHAKSTAFDYVSHEPVRKNQSRGRQAKIHPAWQASSDGSPAKTNSQKETKSTVGRNAKLTENKQMKAQHKSHGSETKSKPKATAPFYKFNNSTKSI